MSNDVVAFLLTIAILLALVLWVPALEMCRNLACRLRRERAWRRFDTEGAKITEALERYLVADRR